MRRVWLLNLDAERELASGGNYATSKRLREQIAREAPRVQDVLCAGEPRLEDFQSAERSELPDEAPLLLPWCPTPAALREARRVRFATPEAPSVEVLRRVNHRSFALDVARSAPLERATALIPTFASASQRFEAARSFVTPGSVEAADLSWLERPRLGRGFRLKRSYGFAGKGQRRLVAALGPDDRRWLQEALDAGGFVAEPEVTLAREFSLHGLVDGAGVLLGQPCELVCDRFGAPLRVERTTLAQHERATANALFEAASALAAELTAVGYFGPFGLDARLFDSEYGPGLTLIGDVNARFTLGWSIGLGSAREEALARLAVAHS